MDSVLARVAPTRIFCFFWLRGHHHWCLVQAIDFEMFFVSFSKAFLDQKLSHSMIHCSPVIQIGYYLEKPVTQPDVSVFSYNDISHILLWEGFTVSLVPSLLSHHSQDSSLWLQFQESKIQPKVSPPRKTNCKLFPVLFSPLISWESPHSSSSSLHPIALLRHCSSQVVEVGAPKCQPEIKKQQNCQHWDVFLHFATQCHHK